MELIIWRQILFIFRHERHWSGTFGNEFVQWTTTIAIVTVTCTYGNKTNKKMHVFLRGKWKHSIQNFVQQVHNNRNILSIIKLILDIIHNMNLYLEITKIK